MRECPGVGAPGPGPQTKGNEPMIESNSSEQESIDEELIKDINQLKGTGFGEGAAICHVCDELLVEGDCVVVLALRPVSAVVLRVGFVFCQEHEGCAGGVWSRAAREVVVRGRVGTVLDGARQESWSVLLGPEVLRVSPVGSDSVVWLSDEEECKDGSRGGVA